MPFLLSLSLLLFCFVLLLLMMMSLLLAVNVAVIKAYVVIKNDDFDFLRIHINSQRAAKQFLR